MNRTIADVRKGGTLPIQGWVSFTSTASQRKRKEAGLMRVVWRRLDDHLRCDDIRLEHDVDVLRVIEEIH